MPDSLPLYLTQGSAVLVFKDVAAGKAAYEECLRAFQSDGMFRSFRIRRQIELPWWMNHQPSHPWWIDGYRCLIFGIEELPPRLACPPDLEEQLILSEPPMCSGNHISRFGLYTPRLQDCSEHIKEAQKLVTITIRSQAAAA